MLLEKKETIKTNAARMTHRHVFMMFSPDVARAFIKTEK
jgi:hypothetical protein